MATLLVRVLAVLVPIKATIGLLIGSASAPMLTCVAIKNGERVSNASSIPFLIPSHLDRTPRQTRRVSHCFWNPEPVLHQELVFYKLTDLLTKNKIVLSVHLSMTTRKTSVGFVAATMREWLLLTTNSGICGCNVVTCFVRSVPMRCSAGRCRALSVAENRLPSSKAQSPFQTFFLHKQGQATRSRRLDFRLQPCEVKASVMNAMHSPRRQMLEARSHVDQSRSQSRHARPPVENLTGVFESFILVVQFPKTN